MSRSGYKKRWAEERRERLLAQGLCVRCGVNESIEDETCCQSCKDRKNRMRRERHKSHPERLRSENARWRRENREKVAKRTTREKRQVRLEVLAHYGGECQCCHTDLEEFLTVDHIEGGGGQHRKEIPSGNIYRWLRREGFPSGFRVLCLNCNSAIHFYGECPHQWS